MDYLSVLKLGLEKLNIKITNEQISRFDSYVKFYMERNSITNLSSIRDENEAVIKHFLDSLSGLNYIEKFHKNNYQIVDLGTGGGFPGVPLKIIRPKWKIDLAEVNKKKISFLSELISKLDIINMEIIDSSQTKINKKYDIVVSRAFGKFEKNISEAIKYLKKDGQIIFYKAKLENLKEEITKSKSVNIKSVVHKETIAIDVPYLEAERHLVRFKYMK